jgi:hypothetical protein
MSAAPNDEFVRLVVAIRPYLSKLVFIGGWAHRLHAAHHLARQTGFAPLMTEDADVLLEKPAPATHPTIGELLARAGFREQLFGDATPAVTHYRLGSESSGLYVEFLVSQIGPGTDRNGAPRPTEAISGVTAQRLPYLDLLAAEPWTVQPGSLLAPEIGDEHLRVANAATYLAHKALVLPRRDPKKRPKDVLYIFDTLTRFSASLPELRGIWQRVGQRLSRKGRQELDRSRAELTTTVTDTIRSAQRVAVESGRAAPPVPEVIVRTLRLGLEAVFGR